MLQPVFCEKTDMQFNELIKEFWNPEVRDFTYSKF